VLEEGSAILPELIAERGYWTAQRWQDLEGVIPPFKGTQKAPEQFPALVIPHHGPDGNYTYSVLRPDLPRTDRQGNETKYEQPAGVGLRLDVPPRCVLGLRDPARTLWFTEGAKKADALASVGLVAVNTPGVTGWRSPSAIPDLFGIPLQERTIVVAYDSDVLSKPAVRKAVEALAAWLTQKGAAIEVLDWQRAELPAGGKTGVDGFLAAGSARRDLEALRVPLAAWRAALQAEAGSTATPYRATPAGLVRVRTSYVDGQPVETDTPLTNFQAAIVGEVVEDDGAETRRLLELEARLGERAARFTLTPAAFAAMAWPIENLGAAAIVYPGQANREHARTAIQMLSGNPAERHVYTHLGWRRLGDQWAYLHAGGAIGPAGPLPDVEVRPPARLAPCVLPAPPTGERLAAAIRADLALLDVAPRRVTVPLLAQVYRSALGTTDFSVHLAGESGHGKTVLAVLMQQHWGPAFTPETLPGSWSSTGNALEVLAFAAKDTVLVVDDFAPNGTPADVQRLHREADRLFRAQGNNAGRQRLRADGALASTRWPRGSLLSTGEDIPHGQSVRARVCILEVAKDDVNFDRLPLYQEAGAAGRYAEALAGFVQWLARCHDDAQCWRQAELPRLRAAAHGSALHRRTPTLMAHLALGWRTFLAFAEQAGALAAGEATTLWEMGWAALGEAAAAQVAHQAAAQPARSFLELLTAALSSGRAHLAAPDGAAPTSPGAWGWRYATIGSGEYARDEWRPQGERAGWIDEADVYLEPAASYAVAQRLARDSGEALAVSRRTLLKRLAERGLLASTERGRETLTVRRVLEAQRRAVVHLHADSLMLPEPDQPDHPDQSGDDVAESQGKAPGRGQVSWSGLDAVAAEPAHETRPPNGAYVRQTPPNGRNGQVGQVFEAYRGASATQSDSTSAVTADDYEVGSV
jgi:hypothetical protein